MIKEVSVEERSPISHNIIPWTSSALETEKIKKTKEENRKLNITPPKINVGLEKRFFEAMVYTRNILNALPAKAKRGR